MTDHNTTAPTPFPAASILGYPRIGRRRELKKAVEAYWAGKIDAAALDYLKSLDWRGNIRELRNVVERLIIMSDDTITEADARTYAGK